MTTDRGKGVPQNSDWHLLSEFALPDEPGREHQLLVLIIAAVHDLYLPAAHLAQLRVLIDSVSKALRHSELGQPDTPIIIRIWALDMAPSDFPQSAIDVRSDEPITEKLTSEFGKSDPAASQGWGYFLIDRSTDASGEPGTLPQRTIELYLYPEGGSGVKVAGSSAPSQPR